MLAVLANETSAIIQFRLTQFLCYISPEERVAVEVKIRKNVAMQMQLHIHATTKFFLFAIEKFSCKETTDQKQKFIICHAFYYEQR